MITFCYVNYSSTIEHWSPEVTWLGFKSYFEDNSPYADQVKWVYPFYSSVSASGTAEELGDKILAENPDVVGFSLYMWNIGLSDKVAAYIKRQKPDVRIILGGPHTPYKRNQQYFKEMWYADLVCNIDGYGEPLFLDYFNQLIEGRFEPKDITFAIYPTKDRSMWLSSSKDFYKRNFVWPRNIYKRNADYVINGNIHRAIPIVFFEASRGCPFGCMFCEWGGGINSKVSFKPTEYVIEDIDFVWDAIRPKVMQFVDANFGIVERDVDIIRHIYNRQKKDPLLHSVSLFGPTKVNKENLYQILEMLMELGIMKDASKIPVQDFDPAVLKNIDRTDGPWQEHAARVRDILSRYQNDGTEVRFELIVGLPGDTLESFYNDFDITGELIPQRHVWWMLPTAPAADPAYIEKYKIKTVKNNLTRLKSVESKSAIFRNDLLDDPLPELVKDPKFSIPTEVVVETYSYTKEQWVEMIMVQGLMMGFIVSGALRTVVQYVHHDSNINLSSFVHDLWHEFFLGDYMHPIQHDIVRAMHQDLLKKVNSEVADNIDYPDLSGVLPFNISARISNGGFILHNLGNDEFFNGLLDWAHKYNDPVLDDAINWTRQAYLSMDYDPTVGRDIESDHDWVGYTFFAKPLVKKPMKWHASDTNKYSNKGDPIEWHKYSIEDKITQFLMPYSSDLFVNRMLFKYEVINE
jgi:putative methyltransferase